MSEDYLTQMTVSGRDAMAFMQGYVTCDLELAKDRVAIPMALTQLKGRVVANGWAIGNADRISLVFHSSLEAMVRKHLAPYLRFASNLCEEPNGSLNIIRSESTDSRAIQIDQFDWALSERESNAVDLAEFQLESGFPLITATTSGRFLPQALGLTKFDTVSFSKGCYLGQEIVARAEHRGKVKRILGTFNDNEQPIQIGAEICAEDGTKGTVIAHSAPKVLMVYSDHSKSDRSDNALSV